MADYNSAVAASGAALDALLTKAGTAVQPDATATFSKAVHEKAIDLDAGTEINVSLGGLFYKTISGGATTLSVSNVPASGSVASFLLCLTNGGSQTVTWWSGMRWAYGSPPVLTTSGLDVLGFYTRDGGTTWTGLVLARDVKAPA